LYLIFFQITDNTFVVENDRHILDPSPREIPVLARKDSVEHLLWWLIAGTKGGRTRAMIAMVQHSSTKTFELLSPLGTVMRRSVLFCEQPVPKARIYYLPRVRYPTKIVRR